MFYIYIYISINIPKISVYFSINDCFEKLFCKEAYTTIFHLKVSLSLYLPVSLFKKESMQEYDNYRLRIGRAYIGDE